jgi:inorganic pyrophosphatase
MEPTVVEVQIEIPKGESVKYEYDDKTHKYTCDRFLHGPFAYPFNYGQILNTLSGDGDPLDAIVICKPSLRPLCHIRCRIVGCLITEDEKGSDHKLILVPDTKIDPCSRNIMELEHIDEHTRTEIRYFFEHYKDNEPDKFVKIIGFVNSAEAVHIYISSKLNN